MEYLGRYKLIERIAIGGMAEIFLAEQPGVAGFSRRVAIKRILPHRADDAEFVEMFLNEARLSALLEHPNIVQIYDLGEADGQYYIAMEYVDGYDLGQILDKSIERKEFISTAYIAKMVAQAAAGLNYAHSYCDRHTGQPLNLIHRDISLPNIMMSKEGVIKLLDFGIAKSAASEQRAPTQTGVLKGKISYMSPEYLMGESIDWRHDLFALGVVMYELATFEKPFEAKGDVQMLKAILTQPPRDPFAFNNQLSSNFVDLLMQILAKEPSARLQTGNDIQQALERFVFQSVGSEVTHNHLGQFVQALFHGQPIPVPGRISSQTYRPQPSHTYQPHSPASGSGMFSKMTTPPVPSTSDDSWMEETRALALDTSALKGLATPSENQITEQTAMLQIDSLKDQLDLGPNGGHEQPMTQELDHSMLPPLNDAPMSSAMTADVAQSSLLEPPATSDLTEEVVEESSAAPSGSNKKLIIALSVLSLVCVGLVVVLVMRFMSNKNKAKTTADTVVQDAPSKTRVAVVQPNNTRTVKRIVARAKSVQAKAPNVTRRTPPLPAFPSTPNAKGASRGIPPLPRFKKGAVAPPSNRRLRYGVYLKSFPRCVVYWQGKKWGYTPIELPMTPGSHNLILRRSNPSIRYPHQITLRENEYLQKTVYIREGFLDIRVTPWARVSIDGHLFGKTPLNPIRLYAGYHRLSVVNPELKKYTTRLIYIRAGRKLKLKYRFK